MSEGSSAASCFWLIVLSLLQGYHSINLNSASRIIHSTSWAIVQGIKSSNYAFLSVVRINLNVSGMSLRVLSLRCIFYHPARTGVPQVLHPIQVTAISGEKEHGTVTEECSRDYGARVEKDARACFDDSPLLCGLRARTRSPGVKVSHICGPAR